MRGWHLREAQPRMRRTDRGLVPRLEFEMYNAKNLLSSALLALAMTGLSATPAAGNGADWYVDAAVEESGDGTEWAEAFKTLQEALDVADLGEIIWVADGKYIPSKETDPEDKRSKTFDLINNVKIYGGFLGNDYPGGGEDSLDQRDPETNVCVLCANYGTTEDPTRVYHVVRAYDISTRQTILSGFSIDLGQADGPGTDEDFGGGMFASFSRPTVTRCTFRWNEASNCGGGMYVRACQPSVWPYIIDCTFANNTGEHGCGLAMRGVVMPSEPMPVINCVFTENGGTGLGGAYLNSFASNVLMVNCTIADNHADEEIGGGIFMWEGTHVTLRNCILWGNTDMQGQDESAQISDGYGNAPDPEYADVRYTCIEGLDELDLPGHYNIGDDPLFAGAGNYRLCTGSPCIDAGNTEDVPADLFDVDDDLDFSEKTPDRDIKDRLMPDEETGPVDMGAYEYRCYADLDGDCDVDVDDLLILLDCWGEPCGDVDGDGDTDTADLLLLLASWGPCGEPGAVPPPRSVHDCIERYGFDPVKLEACIEGMYRAGTP
jgi:hypothetical protein